MSNVQVRIGHDVGGMFAASGKPVLTNEASYGVARTTDPSPVATREGNLSRDGLPGPGVAVVLQLPLTPTLSPSERGGDRFLLCHWLLRPPLPCEGRGRG